MSVYVFNIFSNAQLIHAGVPIGGKVVIGRHPSCDVVVAEPSVSRQHLSLEARKVGDRDVIVLRDEGSRNGLHVNSQKVRERIVGPGDLVRFGCCRLDILRVESVRGAPLEDAASETVYCKWTPHLDDPNAAGRLRALYTMALSLADLEIPFMLEKAAEIVRTCVEFDHFGFLLEGKRGMVLCTSWNHEGPCGKDEVLLDESVIDNCLHVRQPLVTSRRVTSDDSECGLKGDRFVAACVPLMAGGRTLGVLYCSSLNAERPFSQEDVQFLTLVACFVASGISHRWSLADVQRSAAKLEAILGSLQEGVIVCDPDFRVFSANHAARRIFRRDSLVGQPLAELLDGFEHTFDAAAIRAHRSFDLERHRRDASGAESTEIEAYHATVSSAAGFDANGWLFVVCIRDVSRERRNELMHLAFVNRLAHKLRTPLTVMKTVSELVSREGLSPALAGGDEGDGASGQPGIEELADSSCGQMAELIERFVDFTSLGQQRTHLRTCAVPVALRYLVEQALLLAERDIAASGIEIVNAIDDSSIEVVVTADKLCQCFYEIIHNASKFAGRGRRLEIRAEVSESLRIVFEDDGPGIDDGERRRVFDLFHQVDADQTGEVPGVGIGLWWAREVVRVHGGEIRLARAGDDRSGLRVEIVLPLRLVARRAGTARGETSDVTDWIPDLV